jgi:hypothetical protein
MYLNTGEHCEVKLLPCHQTDPCVNNGTCYNPVNSDKAECKCQRGWTGQYCQIQHTLTCGNTNPCLNEGVCIDDVKADKGYSCNCTGSVLFGANCEYSACLSQPCYHGGSCIHIAGKYLNGNMVIKSFSYIKILKIINSSLNNLITSFF